MANQIRKSNRLAGETSPYLLQHAHNPVDWNPWGDEAIARARRENRPIFLSVGYSTCYWCHVMERECFENEEIAAAMNAAFVNIKVDREERPDVDQLYMTAVQVMARQGGWPMSVFLTPDLKPFYGGTYFPPKDHYGRPGFPRVIDGVTSAFAGRREDVNKSAEQITGILRQMSRPRRSAEAIKVDAAWVKGLIDRSLSDFDEEHGGFGTAPKFPRQTVLELGLVYLRMNKDAEMLRMLMRSLDAMAIGGVRDHLGGGFHRYSTDARWLVPHFEIMLYDNAMLLWVYAEAHRQTGEKRYAAVARGIADFVLREMTVESGAFYTALDAEVDGKEGENYLWTRAEVAEALAGKADVARFLQVYGLEDGPNFSDPHHGNGTPDRNVLFIVDAEDGAALMDEELEKARRVLYEVRRGRKQPRLDGKILTSWNGLMIRGLAHAGEILDEPRYMRAAEACADYLWRVHRDSDGGLLRVGTGESGQSHVPSEMQRTLTPTLSLGTGRGGKREHAIALTGESAKQPAFLDDYSFLIQAMLALPGENRRAQAGELAKTMRERFGEESGKGSDGGFFFTDLRATDLIVRQMVGTDSPLPSGNGVAAMVLLELGDVEAARSTISAFAGQMESAGEGMSALLEAALLCVQTHGEWVVEGEKVSGRPRSPAELASQVVAMEPVWEGALMRVQCRVASGYHLNAHDAEVEPTRLTVTGAEVLGIDYPAVPLEGDFEILVRFKSAPGRAIQLNLRYQACDESACLPATTRSVEIRWK